MPTPEAIIFARNVVADDPGELDEDWLAEQLDRFGADRVRDYVDGKPTLQSASAPPQTGGGDAPSDIIRGLLRFADGHELRGSTAEELGDLIRRANSFLQSKPSGGGDAGERPEEQARRILREAPNLYVAAQRLVWANTLVTAKDHERIEAALRSSHREGATAMREAAKRLCERERDKARNPETHARQFSRETTDVWYATAAELHDRIAVLPIPEKTENKNAVPEENEDGVSG